MAQVLSPSPSSSQSPTTVSGLSARQIIPGGKPMSQIAIVNTLAALDRKEQATLTRSTQTMQVATLKALAALRAVSEVHKYAQFKVATSLAASEYVQHGAENLTPTQQAAFQHLTDLYLDTMGILTQEAFVQLVRLAVGPTSQRPGAEVPLSARSGS